MTYQPKSYRKFVAGALSAAVVASAVAPTTASAAGFSDVHSSDYYYEAVMALSEAGVIDGVGDGKFAPQDLVKREQFAKILAGVKKYDLKDVQDPKFSDVKEGEWYYKYVAALKENGITNGVGDGKFGVGQNLSRGQAAKFIVEAFGLKVVEDKEVPFEDIKGSLYEDYIKTLYTNGYVKGVSESQFAPNASITRGALATMIYRVVEGETPAPDKDAPKIELVGDANVEVEYGATYTDAGVKVTDNVDKNLKANVEIKDPTGAVVENIDTTKAGKYTITYTAKDAAGNEADPVVRTVVVKEKPLVAESVVASNGKLMVKMSKEPESVPTVNDFKVTQNINGTTKAINPSSVSWDEKTNTATLVVPVISSTEVDQNVSYTVGYKETAPVSSNTFVVAKVVELKVESARALNSTQIEVVYNQEMDKNSVENIGAYKIANDPAAPTPDYKAFGANTKAVLQADKKTVIITLDENDDANGKLAAAGQLDNKKAFGIQVDNNLVKSATGKILENGPVAKVISLADVNGPLVEKVAVEENGDLTVSFNEKVDGANKNTKKVTVNGYTYKAGDTGVNYAYSVKTGKSSITIAKAQLVDDTKAKLEAGKSYTVVVEGQEDVYGKAMDKLYTSTFTYSSTAVAPKVESVIALSEKEFIIKFNEDVTPVAGGALTVDINKGAKQLATKATTTAFTGREKGEYKVTLLGTDLDNDVLFDRAKNETSTTLSIYIPAVKDNAGNITAEGTQSVTLQKDVTKPSVEKAASNGTTVDVTLTEAPQAVAAAGLAAGSYVLTESGRQIPVTSANFTDALIGGTDKAFTFDYSALNLADGNYTLVVKKDTLTDQSLNGGNKNDEIRIPFVVGTGLQVKPQVSSVDATTTPGKIVITFANPVSYSSAANYQNYKLDGVTIPSNSTFDLNTTGNVLTINLPEATFKETKDRLLSVSGVRNLAGTVMDEYQAVTTVSENEKIKLQSAKVVSGEIILTFNENVNDGVAGTQKFTDTDFNVKVEGTTVAGYTVADFEDVNDVTKLAKNQIKITAPAGISFATGTITVEAVDDGSLATDAAGNTILIDGKVLTATR